MFDPRRRPDTLVLPITSGSSTRLWRCSTPSSLQQEVPQYEDDEREGRRRTDDCRAENDPPHDPIRVLWDVLRTHGLSLPSSSN